jgi:beta-lactamase class A
MQPRIDRKSFSRRQPTNRQPIKHKVQKHRQNKLTSQQHNYPYKGATPTRLKTNPPVNPAAIPTKKPGVATRRSKPAPTSSGRIPPYNPNNVKLKSMQMGKQPLLKKTRLSRKTRLKPMARTILYGVRLLIVGIGIGAIVGTVLSVLDPATRITTTASQSNTTFGQAQPQPTQTPPVSSSALYLSQEIYPLKSVIQNLAGANPNLTPGVFLIDLDNGTYVDINASSSFSSASTIKIPILVAFFQDVDAGKIRLDEKLVMQKEMLAGGSGDMQYKPVGTEYTALEVATKMMTISDNTATNMLIARLGGIDALNQRFQSWGLTATVIRNLLPDLQGTNLTTPKDLGNLMVMVSQGNLVSMPSRDRMLYIMRRNARNHLLPTGLAAGATIAHKTGDIGTTIADAGVVDMPTSKRYIIAVMVNRPNNASSAEKLIGAISRAAYQHFSQPTPLPNTTGTTVPLSGYSSPPMNPQPSNSMGSTIPSTGYQSPMMNPQLGTNPQYSYPYQNQR